MGNEDTLGRLQQGMKMLQEHHQPAFRFSKGNAEGKLTILRKHYPQSQFLPDCQYSHRNMVVWITESKLHLVVHFVITNI